MTLLTQITFRKLENGWTVKYRVQIPPKIIDGVPEKESGFSKEVYAKDLKEVQSILDRLILEHLK